MTRSDIDHYAGLEMWGPYSLADVLLTLEPVGLQVEDTVLDIGCGAARVLIELVQTQGVRGVGLDRSDAALTLARRAAEAAGVADRIEWIHAALCDVELPGTGFELILGLGAPYRGDEQSSAFEAYARWLRPGGYLLMGDGYWSAPPPAAFLEATGIPADCFLDRTGYLTLAVQAGLKPIATKLASRAAWDHFEGTLLANHEAYAAAHPDDADVQAMIATKRRWNDAQQAWGRDCMALALDLFRKQG